MSEAIKDSGLAGKNPSDPQQAIVVENPWTFLRRYTSARIALGRSGNSLPTREVLAFNLAHAQAQDAVRAELDLAHFHEQLETQLGVKCTRAKSQAADRDTYLRRPDLGRRLTPASAETLQQLRAPAQTFDLALVLADGLSAPALEHHAIPTLQALLPQLGSWALAPLILVRHGRVAIGDEIGELLGARLVVVLIGERPGLTAPDSLGIYVTWNPRVGRTDAERNCLSNIHAAGLTYSVAADKLASLLDAARRLGSTGIALNQLASASPLPLAGRCKPEDPERIL